MADSAGACGAAVATTTRRTEEGHIGEKRDSTRTGSK